ncbi:hypothetical protein ACFST9_13310 [Hymenobacter monticola]|uniref:Uncharacterized protein n=1 Tax=Hymenobacter monticola TaxID=1705399 RepID=A0ABY4B3Z9_9BACT|nr:hypothetical protein [Hymenobacter monticola]UOE33579.1 hypothetical protein MTP16_20950 [Hymenobacter monticola]UOE34924.1 hypothetical protein MTP16_04540 [Hymenobacter monticola]
MTDNEIARRAGFFHNFTLDAIAHQPGFSSLTHEQVYNFACENAVSFAESLNLPAQTPVSWATFKEAVTPLVTMTNPLQYLYEQNLISEKEYYLANALDQYAANNLNAETVTAGTFEHLRQEVAAFSDLVENAGLDATATARLLAMASVTEHSALYWLTAQANPDNLWYPTTQGPTKPTVAARGDRLGWYLFLVALDGGFIIGAAVVAVLSIIFWNEPPAP